MGTPYSNLFGYKEICIEESNNEVCLNKIPVWITNGIINISNYLTNDMIL